MKKLLRSVLALLLAVSLCLTAWGADTFSQSREAMMAAVPAPQVGSIGGEWAVLGLARSNAPLPQSYWDTYYAAVEQAVKACGGVLHGKKYTEYSRLVLTLTAIGADPADVAGYNLLTPLADFDKVVWQGVNGPIWALIALDSGSYGTEALRQRYVEEILRCQKADGGWGLTEQSEADLTAMALQALAGHHQPAAVERGLACLSQLQNELGGFTAWGQSNCESTAQAIIALCACGVPLTDGRFVKNGRTLLDDLLTYRQPDGTFVHTVNGGGVNQMAFEQAFLALTALWRAEQGLSPLYAVGDTPIHAAVSAVGLPNKHPAVQKVPVANRGAAFTDTKSAAVTAMAERNILNGVGDGKFAPDRTVTRAEFCAMVVRSLGLTAAGTASFTDIAANAWYAPFVATAAQYGIVSGVGGGKFAPSGTITRQEAAVMTARAAGLCGMDTALGGDAVRNALAAFADYTAVADWAKPAMAFCYQNKLLPDDAMTIEPKKPATRLEIAEMLCAMLAAGKLL